MKKKLIITSICCAILIIALSMHYVSELADSDPTGHPFNLDSVVEKTKEIGFPKLLKTTLEKEGYETISYMVIGQGKKNSQVTIGIAKEEYKGESTEKEIEKIVNRLGKENEIGSFLVNIEIAS